MAISSSCRSLSGRHSVPGETIFRKISSWFVTWFASSPNWRLNRLMSLSFALECQEHGEEGYRRQDAKDERILIEVVDPGEPHKKEDDGAGNPE